MAHAYGEGIMLPFSAEEHTTSAIPTISDHHQQHPIIEITSTGYAKNIEVTVNQKTATLDVEMRKGDRIEIDTSKSYAIHNNKIFR